MDPPATTTRRDVTQDLSVRTKPKAATQPGLGWRLHPDAGCNHHPMVDIQPQAATLGYLQSLESVIERCLEVMPSHADFIAKHCRAARPA